MAATLTQERFTGPSGSSSASSTASACSRSNTERTSGCCRGTGCRRTVYPAVADAIATLPVHDVILDGEATALGPAGDADYHVFDVLWLDGRDVTSLPLDERRALLAPAAVAAAARARRPRSTIRSRGSARCARRLGRRHREAARLALRAPPLAALAEDEVRGHAGARRRRLHRSAGRPRRPRRAARRLLRGRRLRVCRQGRHRLRHEAAARPSRAARRASRSRSRRSRKPRACRACARTGSVPRSSCRSRSSSGPAHGKLRHPRLLAVRFDQPAREVARRTMTSGRFKTSKRPEVLS